MSAPWKDVTSYSRNDKDRTPRCWRVEVLQNFHVTFVNGHLHYPGEWVLTCAPFYDLKRIAANGDPLEAVQQRGLTLVHNKIVNAQAQLAEMLSC